jgi:outer membrane lipoprotein carrier protein
MQTRVLVALVLAVASAVRSAAGADETPFELAEALQKKYDTVRDFSADFVHTYRGGVLRKELIEKGRVLVRKPGRFRWDYTTPEVKQFVSDGIKVYSYVPQDKQVVVTTVSDSGASTPALFLAGKGSLTRDFTPSFGEIPPGSPPGVRALKLVPRVPQPDYDWLLVLVDQTTLALRGLVTGDPQGGTSSLMFVNLKENVGLTDKEFAFKMPRGVDVVTDSGRR